ncbi:ferredoxin [Methylomarinovum tepidoasis]|uniref:Ferredoxin n=1 Tax=Methylomarinovum tepidoasis TaxID=2840183 RepID=A0AAU9C8I2_9GAMM|nr:(4Fe-4S)-binding protein [Methylomarinovum sp. IN45]BCX88142.1 ferredoxin [Methylomarinovum sp. IN45]
MKIHWDEARCCHAGICVKELPQVFKVEDGRLEIDAEAAPEAEIRRVVGMCPAAALAIEEK